MSIFSRLVAIFVIVSLCFALSFVWMRNEHVSFDATLYEHSLQERTYQFFEIDTLLSGSLKNYVSHFSQSSSMAAFINSPTDTAWRAMMEELPDIFDAEITWVLDRDGETIYTHSLLPTKHSTPLQPEAFKILFSRNDHPVFFAEIEGTLAQIFCDRVQSPEAPERAPSTSGYLVAARFWDKNYLDRLENLLNAKVTQISAKDLLEVELNLNRERLLGEYSILKNAPSWNKNSLGGFLFKLKDNQIIQSQEFSRQERTLLLSTLVVLFLLLTVFLNFWVAMPLKALTRAFRQHSAEELKAMKSDKTEWGILARLIDSFFSQQEALTHEVDEHKKTTTSLKIAQEHKEQIAKDLHDGIIQSLYATGLKLENTNILLKESPEKASKKLEDCKNELSEIIKDVRNFIAGLAPERLKGSNLESALSNLVHSFQKDNVCDISLKIKTSSNIPLSELQNINLFHITHELLSNAIRHSQATAIVCRLIEEEDKVILSVEDNGIGFEPNKLEHTSGLKNIQERVKIMAAKFSYDCPANGGSVISISIPLEN